MRRRAEDRWQAAQPPLDQDGAPARGPASRTRAGRPPRGRLRKLGLVGLAAAMTFAAALVTPAGAQAEAQILGPVDHVATMSTAGTQPLSYSAPNPVPYGIAQFTTYPAYSTIQVKVYFAGIDPAGAHVYIVAGGKIISNCMLPPPTNGQISDYCSLSAQAMQQFEADPSDVIIYIQARPGQPGSPEHLPGGVVLNPGSIWSHLVAVQSAGGTNG
jgi:hypothetical protein